MSTQKVVDGAIAATAGVAVVIADDLVNQLGLGAWRLPVALAVAVVTFAVLQTLFDQLVRHNRGIRRLLIPLASLEGRWVAYSTKHGRDYIGFVNLTYNTKDDRHYVNGESYSSDGVREASWDSAPVRFDEQTLTLEYSFTGKSESRRPGDDPPAPEDPRELRSVDGYTSMEFLRPLKESGHGWYINITPTAERRRTRFERLTDDVITRLQEQHGFPPDSDIQQEFRAGA